MARPGTGFRRFTQAAATLSVLLLPIGLLAQDLSVDDRAELSKTAALERVILTGQAEGDSFGNVVAPAGDVNGDGYEDVIVGAWGSDTAGVDAGRAYIFFGGDPMDHFPDLTLAGETAEDVFGYSVASAGDVNGDGYADVVVGAYGNDAGGDLAGRAYLFFGGSPMNDAADVILTGRAAGDIFGFAVASAGDVNGDGYADVVVGARFSDAGGNDAGRVYLYFGGAEVDPEPKVVLTGEASRDFFGTSVASAGDVNGDGYTDVLVGAPGSDAGGGDAGRAYVFFGGAAMDSAPDLTLTGEAALDEYGGSVASAGDVNGDGFADLVVGVSRNSSGGTFAGRAYLHLGGPSPDAIADLTLTGTSDFDRLGASVASAGDVNCDGYADLIVGADGADAEEPRAGRAFVYYGGSRLDAVADMILNGEATDDLFGHSVASARDVNGDGCSDVIVGAYANDTNGSFAGRAYIYLNAVHGYDLPDEIFTGEAFGDRLGASVTTVEDINGDGYADFVVGAPGNDAAGDDAGQAYVYFGGAAMDSGPAVVLTGEFNLEYYGSVLASAGDVNGDGYADLVVGSLSRRSTDVYFGGSSMDNVPDVLPFVLGGAGDGFGRSVSSAGDVNGDGYDDIIVGSPYRDIGDVGTAGMARLYYGGESMDDFADHGLIGEAANDRFGASVSAAGDLNGDGYADIVVGAWANDAGGQDAGRAYVFFGRSVMYGEPDVVLTGERVDGIFGNRVAAVGDVNGDGYADLAVSGFDEADVDGRQRGRVYLFLGGLSVSDTPHLIFEGEEPEDGFGLAVSGMADVNGDGYDDMVVGAPWAIADKYAGRVYVYFGGAAIDTVPDVILTGAGTPSLYFGTSVASAGDVNGDGYADVLVGAPERGDDPGHAYLYLSSSPSVVPRITSVTDVPGDQGGFVSVRWTRSGYDARGINRVTQYNLYRSDPPGAGGLAWEHVATVPAAHLTHYDYAAPTRSNTTGMHEGATYFMVEADNVWHPDEYWRSAPVMGASVDNLAPAPPQGASIAAAEPVGYRLSWEENTTDPDVWGYLVYRSTAEDFVVGADTRLATTSTAGYLDEAVSGDSTYYYRVTTRDVHGNESVPTAVLVGGVATGIDEASLPAAYGLLQNYPNPFNPETTIRYELPAAAAVRLEVFDALGRRVQVLADGRRPPGRYAVVFEAAGRPSGIYFYRLEAGPYRRTRSLILLR